MKKYHHHNYEERGIDLSWLRSYIKQKYEYRSGFLYSKASKRIIRGTLYNNSFYMLAIYINGIRKHRIPMHRIIYLYFHGHLPYCVHHINGDKFDNRIENLVGLTFSEFRALKSLSGHPGIRFEKRHYSFNTRSVWKVIIQFRGKEYYLGHYPSIEEAKAEYDRAAAQIASIESARSTESSDKSDCVTG